MPNVIQPLVPQHPRRRSGKITFLRPLDTLSLYAMEMSVTALSYEAVTPYLPAIAFIAAVVILQFLPLVRPRAES